MPELHLVPPPPPDLVTEHRAAALEEHIRSAHASLAAAAALASEVEDHEMQGLLRSLWHTVATTLVIVRRQRRGR